MNGTISAVDDAVGASNFVFVLESISGTLQSDGTAFAISSLDVVGMELLTWHPVPLIPGANPPCFYRPDDNGVAPSCGGDTFFVDAWSNSGLDEWYAPTWSSLTVQGKVDINTLPEMQAACLLGPSSRIGGGGALLSNTAGGWSHTGLTGAAVVSSQHHTPFWTGLRSYDAPGRCSVFSIASATLHVAFVCGSALPVTLTVGLFTDLTDDGVLSGDDINFWRRAQFPVVGATYRTTLPFKLQLDITAYTPQHDWNVISFADALSYIQNISMVTDYYPLTPILVGWQGLGHDTLYPGLDIVNERLGGASALVALAAQVQSNASVAGNRSSLSYHVNTDEAYSLYNATANQEFDIGICRLQPDHVTPWYSNCSVTNEQIPNCGIRCSISKSRDAASFDRYGRIGKLFSVIPEGIQTIHSDAWRDTGASWENGTYLSFESEDFCGQGGDSSFWRSHGLSMGCEGQNGQASELMGLVEYFYHGDGWAVETWGRIVAGSSLGFDNDVYCDNPGGKCGWTSYADSFYLDARIYQLALTDELLSTTTHHRFRGGGRIQVAHTAAARAAKKTQGLSPPSVWPFGGDVIPISTGSSVLVPLVLGDGSVAANVLHAYTSTSAPPPDPNCPLYMNPSYLAANNTALGNWAGPTLSVFNVNLPEMEAVAYCNASCWGNSSCFAWDMIKVTPYSGKLIPQCSLYAAGIGCEADSNQWSGTKAVIPYPTGNASITWVLPLSWEGHAITATTLTPDGPIVGIVNVTVTARNLVLNGIEPGLPVRLTVDIPPT